MIASSGRRLYYHSWRKENSTHSYAIDFLLPSKGKLVALEIKSSSIRFHDSILAFSQKYSSRILGQYLLSEKDVGQEEGLQMKPLYMLPFVLEDI